MSNILDIKQYLIDHSLDDGYKLKLYRWNDADLDKKSDTFMVLRPRGGGVIDRDIGREFYSVVIVGGANEDPDLGDSRSQLIRDTMITNYNTNDVIQFQFNTNVQGPFYIDNDRPVYEINFIALTSRG